MFYPVIGLEIHVRLKTKSKMFCACPNIDDDSPVNAIICPICTGHPGTLPAINEEALHLGVRAGLALSCSIPRHTRFDRKNYFYPDLPKGYQITQFEFPVAVAGTVSIDIPNGKPPRDRIRIGITRAHLEEDAAKNIHDAKTQKTLIDFNRAGAPLLEIVTEPDLKSPQEAKIFLQELQSILRCANVSDADMEKGFMRCDANISLLEYTENNERITIGLNPKVEIKNLNSFRSVERALTYEIRRQSEIYVKGETVKGETRGWDENNAKTVKQRSKETSADYRYFPEPDLPALDLTKIKEKESRQMPELPTAKRLRLMDEFGFTQEDARFLVINDVWADFAEQIMNELGSWIESTDTSKEKSGGEILCEQKKKWAKLVGSWLANKFAGLLTQKNLELHQNKISAENFAEFIKIIADNKINSANAQKLLSMMMDTGSDPSHLMEEHDLGQNEDPKLIEETVARLVEQNPDQVKQIREGKLNVIKWFVGGVMKTTEGRANPEQAEKEIRKQLEL